MWKKFKYFETIIINHEEVKSRLNSWNACHHSVQNILTSHLISKSINMKVYRIVIYLLFYIGVDLVSHMKGRTQIKGV
jgi:hypothetical protein